MPCWQVPVKAEISSCAKWDHARYCLDLILGTQQSSDTLPMFKDYSRMLKEMQGTSLEKSIDVLNIGEL